MEVIVLKNRLSGIRPVFAAGSDERSLEEEDYEISLLLGEQLDEDGFTREIKAHTDRIKLLEGELQRSRAEAYSAGFQEGQSIAKVEANKRFTQSTLEFSQAISSIQQEYEAVLEQMSEPLLSLAIGAAEAVIQYELRDKERTRQILLAQIQRILNETITQSRAVIQVNTDQLAWITGVDVLEQLNLPQKSNLRFIPNPKLGPGECLMETEDFLVDSTIHMQLAILEKALRDSDAGTADQI